MGVVGSGLSIPLIGEGFLPDGVYIARVQLGGGAASDYTRTDDTTVEHSTGSNGFLTSDSQSDSAILFSIEASTGLPIFVHGVWADVPVAFTASVAISIGDSDDALKWIASSDLVPTSTNAGIPASTLIVGSSAAGVGGKLYTSTNEILALVTGADPTTGLLNVYVMYSKYGANALYQ